MYIQTYVFVSLTDLYNHPVYNAHEFLWIFTCTNECLNLYCKHSFYSIVRTCCIDESTILVSAKNCSKQQQKDNKRENIKNKSERVEKCENKPAHMYLLVVIRMDTCTAAVQQQQQHSIHTHTYICVSYIVNYLDTSWHNKNDCNKCYQNASKTAVVPHKT